MQARLLYHEAAALDTSDTKAPSEQRLLLLYSALSNATVATNLCPESLSSAALRATMVVNVLVEATAASAAAGSAKKVEVPNREVCEELRNELSGAMEACAKALAAKSQLVEPGIAINADQMKTHDPCSLVKLLITPQHDASRCHTSHHDCPISGASVHVASDALHKLAAVADVHTQGEVMR